MIENAISAASAAKLSLRVGLARVAKADLSVGDLAAGGLRAPEQAAPKNRRTSFRGIPVEVDRPKGFVQRGKAKDGTPWERTYKVDYGFVPGVESLGDAVGDGEELDVYLDGWNDEYDEGADVAYLLLQVDEDGAPDELKVVLGARSRERAREIYVEHAPERLLAGVAEMPVDMLKALLGIGEVSARKAIEAVAKSLWSAIAPVAERVPSDATVERTARIVSVGKALGDGPEQRFVLGIVLEPEVVDAQGDVYSAEEVRKAQRIYMRRFQNVGLNHKRLVNGQASLVESWIAPVDIEVGGSKIRAGTWLMGVEVDDDDLWAKIKSGELSGYSIGGLATRDPIPA